MGIRIQRYRGNTPATPTVATTASASPPAHTSHLVTATEAEG